MDSIVNWSISRCVTINSNPDTNLSLTPTLSPYFHHFAHAMSRSQTEMYHTSNGASCLRISVVFTARCYASAVLAMALCPSVCLSVCLSVTSRCSTKMTKRRITQTPPHDTPGSLVFWCQRSPQNSTGVTPTGAPNAGGVGQNRRLSTNIRLYLENGKR